MVEHLVFTLDNSTMKKYAEKYCKHHGVTRFVLRTENNFRCMKCAVASVSKRRRILKLKSIEYKGGKCVDCGLISCYPSVYDFHHTTDDKDFNIGCKGITRSWEKVKSELDKCVLLCANCHRIRHSKESEGQVGFEPTRDIIPSD